MITFWQVGSILVWLAAGLVKDSRQPVQMPVGHYYEDAYQWFGHLGSSLPVHIRLMRDGDQYQGNIRYGKNEYTRDIEGQINEKGTMVLYEFDQYSRVSAILTGDPANTNSTWTWTDSKYSLEISLSLNSTNLMSNVLEVYQGKGDNTGVHKVLLNRSTREISIDLTESTELRWMGYECEGQDCYEKRSDLYLSNPTEFRLDDQDASRIKIYPEHVLFKTGELKYSNISEAGYAYYVSVDVPSLGQKDFDAFLRSEAEGQINRWISLVSNSGADITDSEARFEHRFWGDFFITLMDKSIMSGYLYFQGSTVDVAYTLPFMYDIQRKRLFTLADIFKKEFDYPFFLKTYIEKKKRSGSRKEDSMVREMVKDENYTHFVIDHDGLIFFTEFHALYGRRSIKIPFTEVKGFIKHKTLESFIKRNGY